MLHNRPKTFIYCFTEEIHSTLATYFTDIFSCLTEEPNENISIVGMEVKILTAPLQMTCQCTHIS